MIGRRAMLFAPLGATLVGGAAFYAMLQGEERGTFDPRGVPNPRVGQPVPDFSLPAQAPGQGFSSVDILAAKRPLLVNFFASWCIPCVEEAGELMKLSKDGALPVWGIAYKDKPEEAARFLERHGNPYARLASDQKGDVAINWGVYGVPESYFIDAAGVIRWRWAGALTPQVVSDQLHRLMRTYA